jgi:putative membrane protein insertion efficiency factor
MKKLLLKLIRLYQHGRWFYRPVLVSLWLSDGSCRFDPTCSAYCYQAIEKYGTLKGAWRCLRRIVRCHPWSKGGRDPIT